MNNWLDEYHRKLIPVDTAVGFVKSGDRVVCPVGREAHALGLALAARKEDLVNVEILVPMPGYDFGWYDEGWQGSFNVTVLGPTATGQEAIDKHLCDIVIPFLIPDPSEGESRKPDVVFVEISPPDDHGFCSFGSSLWDKKRRIEQGKLVIGEINKNLIRTYGDNFVHISQIDYFVEHTASGGAPGLGSLAGRSLKEPEPYVRDIAANVSQLINDGDTIQIGVGRTNEPLVRLGMLDNKHDLGFHSEATPPGIITLVREGIITGKYKTVNPNKVVVTSIGGSTKEEMIWVHNNPMFNLVDVQYLEDIRIIAAHDNFVAINQALAIDFSGQITAESLGPRLLATAGGQIPFVFGALLSKGGKAITVLPSTAQGGAVSRIVAHFQPGTVFTIQRNCADYVVTEFGIARLRGKTIRQRARELIAIAHPNFRSELQEEARRLYWP